MGEAASVFRALVAQVKFATNVERGPYGEYLKYVRRQVGDRVWDSVQDMYPSIAWAILVSLGAVPWEHSAQHRAFMDAIERGIVVAAREEEPEDDDEADSWALEADQYLAG